MKEYVIWGKKPGNDIEQLLLTAVQGIKITSRTQAETFRKILESHNCTDTRIQEIDFSDSADLFIKAIN